MRQKNMGDPMPLMHSPEYWPELDTAGERVNGIRWCKPVSQQSLEATRMCAGFRSLYDEDDINFKHVCSEELHL